MLRRDICKNKRIKSYKFMSELFYSFRCHFYNRVFAFCGDGIPQKFLYKETPGHCHFKKIGFFFFSDFETNCICKSCFLPRGFKYFIYQFHNGCLAFCAHYCDNKNFSRWKFIIYRSGKSEKKMIYRLSRFKNLSWNNFSSKV